MGANCISCTVPPESRIPFCFADGDSRDDDRHRAKVQWYWRDVDVEQIPKKRRPELRAREVFLNCASSLFDHDIDLGTVVGKCKVRGLVFLDASPFSEPMCGRFAASVQLSTRSCAASLHIATRDDASPTDLRCT